MSVSVSVCLSGCLSFRFHSLQLRKRFNDIFRCLHELDQDTLSSNGGFVISFRVDEGNVVTARARADATGES